LTGNLISTFLGVTSTSPDLSLLLLAARQVDALVRSTSAFEIIHVKIATCMMHGKDHQFGLVTAVD